MDSWVLSFFLIFAVITVVCASQFILTENLLMLVLTVVSLLVAVLLLSGFTDLFNPIKQRFLHFSGAIWG